MKTACLQGAWKQRTWSTWYPNHLWFFSKSSSGGFKVTVPSRLSYLSGSSSLAFPTKTLFLGLSLKPESPWMGSSSHLISFSIRGLSPLQSAPPLWGPPLNFSRSNPQSRPECQIASQCSRWTTWTQQVPNLILQPQLFAQPRAPPTIQFSRNLLTSPI